MITFPCDCVRSSQPGSLTRVTADRNRRPAETAVIIVELWMWPHGDRTKKYPLGAGTIVNDGSGTALRGNYVGGFGGKNGSPVGDPCNIKDFPRKKHHAWDLVFRALRASVGHRNPQKTTRDARIDAIMADLDRVQRTLSLGGLRVFCEGYIDPIVRQVKDLHD